jgi:hypothetical protein
MESKACSCKLIPSRESVMCIIQSRNVLTYVPQGYSHIGCLPQSAKWWFALFMMRYGIPINSAWFKDDDFGPHISNAVLRFLSWHFQVLSNRYPVLFEEEFLWPITYTLVIVFCGFTWRVRFFRNIRTQFWNYYPIGDWSRFYRNINDSPEQFCYSFAYVHDLRGRNIKLVEIIFC